VRRPEFVARQSACPSGPLGRLIGHVMARETAAVNDAALLLLDLARHDQVLEVGFGHGRTIMRAAAAVSGGFVAGVDPSSEMCRMARRRNRGDVARGRVEIHQASAESLPFPAARFDKVLTVHTVYFWRDLRRPLEEIARVVKPGGRLVLVHRTDSQARSAFPAAIYRFPSQDEVAHALSAAGFRKASVVDRDHGGSTLSFHAADR
jgi:SAM-dependent methyltransferase